MRRFLAGYERFLLALLDPDRERLFATELYRLAEYAEHGTLSAAMASEPAVRLLVRLWNRPDLPTAPARPTLHDALTATDLLEHALRPLAAVPPAAPPLGAVRLLAVLALGSTLWTGLLLQAFGSAWTPAVVCSAAATAEAVAPAGEFSRTPVVRLAVCGVATAVLFTAATALLGRMTTHR
ncbi:hypothetical protein [Streptomyces cucumeris]|uniref:hypothetical protein n=1 Tax=Streptomyces cucumeris TaxID=2962890 RepID=UPI003D711921